LTNNIRHVFQKIAWILWNLDETPISRKRFVQAAFFSPSEVQLMVLHSFRKSRPFQPGRPGLKSPAELEQCSVLSLRQFSSSWRTQTFRLQQVRACDSPTQKLVCALRAEAGPAQLRYASLFRFARPTQTGTIGQ